MSDLPITDPRWLASTQPDREPETQPVHWRASEITTIWPNAALAAIACGAEGNGVNDQDKVTCPACLQTVFRRRCLALEPTPGPLPRRCHMREHDGPHDWEHDDLPEPDEQRQHALQAGAESAAASAASQAIARRQEEAFSHANLDTPSGLLPVRVPGAALVDAEGESGATDAGNAAGPLEGESEREVLETWAV